MHIVFFTHPSFLSHLSLPRYARMLVSGMEERGHTVEVWSPKAQFINWPAPKATKKWLGYLDQYLVFPREVQARLKRYSPDTLFVVTDNALGPWVPLVADRLHVIHCHDFLAQRSALGMIPENRTSWTGRQYQAFIRRGYSAGKNFISVSQKTKDDLHRLLPAPPATTEVIYNSLDPSFQRNDAEQARQARQALSRQIGLDLTNGYLLHIGGNVWYKNRSGVIEMYDAWRSGGASALPLLLIGEPIDAGVVGVSFERAVHKRDIYVLSNLNDETVRLAYAGAQLLLFPSLAEGFGWPIIEAMSLGCPVLTTDEAPMTEVAGKAAFLIPRQPFAASEVSTWASKAASVIDRAVNLSPAERTRVVDGGVLNAQRFDYESTMDQIERHYQEIAHE